MHPSYLIAGISGNAGKLRLTSISMGERITVEQNKSVLQLINRHLSNTKREYNAKKKDFFSSNT